jgi:type II secretory pathway component GspD/PulD (secretin)
LLALLAVPGLFLATNGAVSARSGAEGGGSAPVGMKLGLPSREGPFAFRAAPWSEVFNWLSKRTGKPIITIEIPRGTFTFVPSRAGQAYTDAEVIDILNDALLAQEFTLRVRERSLALVPVRAVYDPGRLPRVTLDNLDSFGKREVVPLVVPLGTLKLEAVVPEVQKLLGPCGELAVIPVGNSLLLSDTAGNLRHIYRTIQNLEKQQRK